THHPLCSLTCQASPSVQSEIPSKARSLMRNWPGSADRAGKPPRLGSHTPGVVTRKLRVVRNMPTASRLPSAQARGANGRAAMSNAMPTSTTPSTAENPRTLMSPYTQLSSGLLATNGRIPSASYPVNFMRPIQPTTTTKLLCPFDLRNLVRSPWSMVPANGDSPGQPGNERLSIVTIARRVDSSQETDQTDPCWDLRPSPGHAWWGAGDNDPKPLGRSLLHQLQGRRKVRRGWSLGMPCGPGFGPTGDQGTPSASEVSPLRLPFLISCLSPACSPLPPML